MSSSPFKVRYPQLAKEPLITTTHRGNPENRLLAKIIDFFLVLSVCWSTSFIWVHWNWILAVLIWMTIDRVGRGQSPGKWLLGLHTIELQKGERIGLYSGLIRNLPFILANTGLATGSWLWALFLFPAAIMVIIECYFVFSLRSGVRVGDVLGNTRVMDFKDEHTKFIEQFLKEEEAF